MIKSQVNYIRNLVNLGDDDRVHIRDSNYVENVINKFVQDGQDKLQVISDFDMTLSRYRDKEGNKCDSCYHAIDASSSIPSSYKVQAESLKSHYYPIEMDPSKTIEEKIPFMVEWWSKAHDLMVGCDIRKEQIPKFVENSRIYFRDGSDWMLQQLHSSKVPLLVFSAGLGDIIEEAFRQRLKCYDNMKIVSNFMHFNDQGVMDGFVGELLHVFNKNENVVHKSDYFDKLRNRRNILLMGDSLGDLRMAEGANCDKILRIGFLNDKIEENLEKYVNSFDIVIVNDQSMDVPNSILRKICQPKD